MAYGSMDYGSHPTRYASLSDDEFYANFRDSVWRAMDNGERQEVLQEAVNRGAALNGEIGSCTVSFRDDLGKGIAACQYDSQIDISMQYHGKQQDESVESGWCALESALHEDRHAWQNQIADGVISNATAEETEKIRANGILAVDVTLPDGSTKPGLTYVSNTRNTLEESIYRAQYTEADAFRTSESRVCEICSRQMKLMERESWENPTDTLLSDWRGASTYCENLKQRCHESVMEAYEKYWHVDHLEDEVNTALSNLYAQKNDPVHPFVDEVVREASVHEYEVLSAQAYGAQSVSQSQKYGAQDREQTAEQADDGYSAAYC